MSNILELLSCENVKYIGASDLWELGSQGCSQSLSWQLGIPKLQWTLNTNMYELSFIFKSSEKLLNIVGASELSLSFSNRQNGEYLLVVAMHRVEACNELWKVCKYIWALIALALTETWIPKWHQRMQCKVPSKQQPPIVVNLIWMIDRTSIETVICIKSQVDAQIKFHQNRQ